VGAPLFLCINLYILDTFLSVVKLITIFQTVLLCFLNFGFTARLIVFTLFLVTFHCFTLSSKLTCSVNFILHLSLFPCVELTPWL